MYIHKHTCIYITVYAQWGETHLTIFLSFCHIFVGDDDDDLKSNSEWIAGLDYKTINGTFPTDRYLVSYSKTVVVMDQRASCKRRLLKGK